MWVTRQLLHGPFDFHSSNIIQNNLFYVPLKKETHTILEQLEGEKVMTEFEFLSELYL